MNSSQVVSKNKLITSIILAVLISFGVSYCDLMFLKPMAIIKINNYSAVLITIWTILATLSTLTVAFLSIFTAKLNEKYFGLTVKELLARQVDKLKVNYFERLLIVILLNFVMCIPVLMNSMFAVILLMLVQATLLLYTLYLSLRVSMDDSFAKEQAKIFVHNILENELITPETVNEYYRKNELLTVIDKIIIDLTDRVDEKTHIDLSNDDDFLFLTTILGKTREKKPRLHGKCESELITFFYTLMRKEQYSVSIHLYKWLESMNVQNTQNLVKILANSYYDNRLPPRHYAVLISKAKDDITQNLSTYFDSSLLLMFQIIKNADENNFRSLCTSIMQINYASDNSREDFIHAMSAYIYHLALKENKYVDIYNEEKYEIVKRLITSEFSHNGEKCTMSEILKNTHRLIGLIKTLSMTTEFDSTFNSEEFAIPGTISRWGIDTDVHEYAAFMLFSVYEKKSKYLSKFDLEFLIRLRKSLTDDGRLIDNFKDNYRKFTEWLEWTHKEDNTVLLNHLDKVLKQKVMENLKVRRENIIAVDNSINVMMLKVKEHLKQSPFDASTRQDLQHKLCENSRIADIRDFTGVMELLSLDKNLFDDMCYNLYIANTDNLAHYELPSDLHTRMEAVDELIGFLETQKVALEFNINYNRNISNFFPRGEVSEKAAKRFRSIDEGVHLSEFEWDIGSGSAIYLNDTLFKPSIHLDSKFIGYDLQLDDDEIKRQANRCRLNDGNYYFRVNNSLQLLSTYDECYEYMKLAKFKLNCYFEVAKSDKPFGSVVHMASP